MKRAATTLCILFAAAVSVSAKGAARWRVLKSKHVLVYYVSDRRFAETAARAAEQHYVRIANALGYRRRHNFWLWDNRARIYIHDSRRAFSDQTGAPVWAVGKAVHSSRSIHSYRNSADFLESLLPHEMAHLIFRDFVGFKGEVPLWLDEGVAQWQEKDKRESARDTARSLLRTNALLGLRSLTSMDVRRVRETGKAVAFYAQAVSVVGFLIEEYGMEKFTKFCRQLRDGKDLSDALRFTYPQSVRNLSTLEKRWKAYVLETEK